MMSSWTGPSKGHQCECRHRVDGLSPTHRGRTWGLCSQLAKVDPDWRSPGKSLSPHRSLNTRKGVAKFGRAAIGMSNEEVKDAINSSPRNRGIPFVAEAYRVSVNRNKQRQQTGTLFLTFQAIPQRKSDWASSSSMWIYTSHHHADALSARSLAITQEPVELKRMYAQHALLLVTGKKHAPTLIPQSAWTAKGHTWPRAGSVLGFWWRRLLCKYKQRAIAQLPKHVSKQSRHLRQPMIPMPQQQVQIRPLWTSPHSSVTKVGPYNPKMETRVKSFKS